MISGQRILAIIPARSGSVGVPGKNIRMVAGKPLLAWTIEAALHSRYLDRVIISTDTQEIAHVASSFGCEVPFLRPAEIARSETPSSAVVLHALEWFADYDLIMLLQPTSPLRTTADIDAALDALLESQSTSCIGVCEAHPHPNWMKTIDESGMLQPFLPAPIADRRQDLPPVYGINGAVYVASVAEYKAVASFQTARTQAYVMPAERSLEIDNEFDLFLCEQVLKCRESANNDA